MLLVTTPEVPGREIKEVLGIVYASSVRTRGLGGKLAAGIEGLVGGKGSAYLKEVNAAREEVLKELSERAEKMGANAVVGIDFELSEILQGFIIVSAYGTAVKIE